MYWVNINNGFPPEEEVRNSLWFDVWVDGERLTDVKFKDGEFYEQVTDYQGDYSHDEKISGVTHWMLVEDPEI